MGESKGITFGRRKYRENLLAMMSDLAGQQLRLSAVPIGPNAHSGSAAAPTLFPTEEDEYFRYEACFAVFWTAARSD